MAGRRRELGVVTDYEAVEGVTLIKGCRRRRGSDGGGGSRQPGGGYFHGRDGQWGGRVSTLKPEPKRTPEGLFDQVRQELGVGEPPVYEAQRSPGAPILT